jgi:hypothetical protein
MTLLHLLCIHPSQCFGRRANGTVRLDPLPIITPLNESGVVVSNADVVDVEAEAAPVVEVGVSIEARGKGSTIESKTGIGAEVGARAIEAMIGNDFCSITRSASTAFPSHFSDA